MSGAEPLIFGAIAGGAIDKENPMRGAVIGATGMNLLAGGLGTAASAYSGQMGAATGAGAAASGGGAAGINLAPTGMSDLLASRAAALSPTVTGSAPVVSNVAATPKNFRLFSDIGKVTEGSLQGRPGVTGIKMFNNVSSGGLLATPDPTKMNQLAQQAMRNLLSPQQGEQNTTVQTTPIKRGSIMTDEEEEDQVGSILQAKLVKQPKRGLLGNATIV